MNFCFPINPVMCSGLPDPSLLACLYANFCYQLYLNLTSWYHTDPEYNFLHACKFVYKINSMQFACWVIFHAFVAICFFFQLTFSKKSFRNSYQRVKRYLLDQDQEWIFCWSLSGFEDQTVCKGYRELARKGLNILKYHQSVKQFGSRSG